MSWRTPAERWAHAVWRRRGLTARLLWPLGLLHRAWRRFMGWRYQVGLARASAVGVPVIVVGNLYVGGTGKTALAIALVRQLAARGWHPGVVARGYGTSAGEARRFDPQGDVRQFGDEPLEIARATGVPVAVGRDRAAAARLLARGGGAGPSQGQGDCDVIIADDGLQHYGLARDFEIAVVDDRGWGNGWLLPAGPLRDPPKRLAFVDAVVFNGAAPTVRVYSPFYALETEVREAWSLTRPSQRIALAELRRQQVDGKLQLLAACGIGNPRRFFQMLAAAGLDVEELALHDHYPYADDPFAARRHDRVLITEKDAVKCAVSPSIAQDPRIWVVPLHSRIDERLIDLIESRIGKAPHDGPAPA